MLVGNLHWKERSADLFAVANLECSVHPLPFAGKENEGISSTSVGPQTETETIEQGRNRHEAALRGRGDPRSPGRLISRSAVGPGKGATILPYGGWHGSDSWVGGRCIRAIAPNRYHAVRSCVEIPISKTYATFAGFPNAECCPKRRRSPADDDANGPGTGALKNFQRAAKAVVEAHRVRAGMRGGAAGLAQITFDDPDEDVQHGADGLRLPLQPRQQFSTEEVSRLGTGWPESIGTICSTPTILAPRNLLLLLCRRPSARRSPLS